MAILILLLIFLVALLLGRRRGWQRSADLQSIYTRSRALCLLYAILIPLMVVAALQRHDQPPFEKFFSPGCFTLVFGIFFFQFLQARRKMPSQPGFTGKVFDRSTLRLLGQAAFILLPVLGLAGFGLYSLRQDRLLAEQEAHDAGQIVSRQLAQAIGTRTPAHWRDYREASFALHANRSADLGLSSWAGGAPAETNAWLRIQAWQQANPEIDLTNLPPADPSSYVETQPEMMPPQPPEWLGQLNPEQQKLWQCVKQAAFQVDDFSAVQSAIQTFMASHPPKGARANAEYLRLLANIRGMTATGAVSQIAEFTRTHWGDSTESTDAGLPLGQLVCYQALHRLPDGAGLPPNFITFHTIAWMIQYRASVFSPRLVAEAERVARGTASEQYVATLKHWCNANSAARIVLQDFREQHPPATWTNAPFWVDSRIGKYLLILGDRCLAPTNWVVPSAPRYLYLMLPQVVVETALGAAVKDSEIWLPPYAKMEFDFGDQPISLSPGLAADCENRALPLLGQAGGILKDLPLSQHAYPFRIRVLLANPEILYARQAQRSRGVGALIIASALAAVMGLFSAWRSFRREQRLNQLKTDFVSSVSHELRAPIASVRLMAENLAGDKIPEPEKQQEYFRFIGQECRRLSSLIENVLDFSRIEQGRKQYEFEPTELVSLTQTTVQLMAPYAAEKGVRLEMQSALGNQKIEMAVDGRALQQALINLLDNAIKHSGQGQTVAIAIESGSQGCFNLSVSDCGPGIPQGEHERIFERFYRLGSELRRETQGIGIGLSIVKHIVAAHGGRVTVASEPGQGCRFTIILPAKHNHGTHFDH